MANHKSAEKRARQTIKRTAQNKSALSAVRTNEKKVRAAVANQKSDEANLFFKEYMSSMTKAAQKGMVKFQTASRKVSRLSKFIHKTFSPAK